MIRLGGKCLLGEVVAGEGSRGEHSLNPDLAIAASYNVYKTVN